MVDWGLSWQIVGVGIATVAIVLGLVTLVLWLVGTVFHKVFYKGGESEEEKRGE